MVIKRVKYRSLRKLLQNELVRDEHPPTEELMRRLSHVKLDGEFSRTEFLEMCHWKSPRAIHHCQKNSATTIHSISRAVLQTRSERKKLELLTSLHGVGVPTASAILTLIDPKRYGVIDIRVWQLLFAIKSVRKKPQGQGFNFKNWYHYLCKLRYHAKELGVPVRVVEYTLFQYHRKMQTGKLYDGVKALPN